MHPAAEAPRVTRWLLVSLLALTAHPVAARSDSADTLSVVSLNIWHDQRDWPQRLQVILAGLRELRPDVLCLQEVLQHEHLRNQAETLADSLGYRMHFTSVDSVHHAKRYGNAILTPHAVLRTGGRNLAPANDYRTVAHVRIDFRGRPIDVYDTHLHHTAEGGAIRAEQIGDLLAFVDSTRGGGPLVLAGDFNAELDAPEMEPLLRDYASVFRAAHPSASREQAATYGPVVGSEPRAIDHVFVAREGALRPLAGEVLFRRAGPGGVWASDHFGVGAWVEVWEATGGGSVE